MFLPQHSVFHYLLGALPLGEMLKESFLSA
jgi:hypothetical protein